LALFGVHDLEQQENVTEEEIRMMVDVSEETGGIEAAEKEMILGVFDFADRTVDEIKLDQLVEESRKRCCQDAPDRNICKN